MKLKDVKDKFFILTQEKRVELGITPEEDLPNKIENREIVKIRDITKKKKKDKIYYEVILDIPFDEELTMFTEYFTLKCMVSSEKDFENLMKDLFQEVDIDLARHIKHMRILDLLIGNKVKFED